MKQSSSPTAITATPCPLPALASDILDSHDSVRGVVRAKLANLVATFRPSPCSRVGSAEDLFGVTYAKLVEKKCRCKSPGRVVNLAKKIAKNLLIDNSKQSITRGRFVISIEDLRKSDDDWQNQDCGYFEFCEASRAAARDAENAEMKELFEAAAAKLRKLDHIDRVIFAALSDHVHHSEDIPNDRKLAESIGCKCKQNTLTVRRHKLQAQLQGFLKELGFVHPSKRRQESRPPASPSPKSRPGRSRPRKSTMPGSTPNPHQNAPGRVL